MRQETRLIGRLTRERKELITRRNVTVRLMQQEKTQHWKEISHMQKA